MISEVFDFVSINLFLIRKWGSVSLDLNKKYDVEIVVFSTFG